MIDLDAAAQELTESVARIRPDLPRVQGIARRRRRRRRVAVSAVAALVLLAGGAAALAATGDDGSDQVHAGVPTATTSTPTVEAEQPITLPCGLTVVANRRDLALPDDLNVATLQGLGGTGLGSEGPCAVNLTAVDDPARHISFVQGTLAYALGDDEQVIDGARPVRWGTIEDGYGAELPASGSDERMSVLAYGVPRAEVEALLRSLAAG